MIRKFLVTAELTALPEATPKEVDKVMKRYLHDLKLAGCDHWVGDKKVVEIGTESIKDEQGVEVMTPWREEK